MERSLKLAMAKPEKETQRTTFQQFATYPLETVPKACATWRDLLMKRVGDYNSMDSLNEDTPFMKPVGMADLDSFVEDFIPS